MRELRRAARCPIGMKVRRSVLRGVWLASCQAGVFALLAGCFCARPLEAGPRDTSKPADSDILLTLVWDPNGSRFLAVLRNVSNGPKFLVLGRVEGNDTHVCPSQIELLVSAPDGKTTDERSQLGCPWGVIGGRLDPFVVPLSAGASYSIPVLVLSGGKSGHYRVKAKYIGVALSLKTLNADMPGLSLIHYWTGVAESNVVTVELRNAP